MAVKCVDKKIVDTIVKGSFHQGDLSIFSAESVGKQCIPNCFTAVSLPNWCHYKWSCDNIDSILRNGDSIYKTIKSNHDLLHVSDVGSRIHAFHQTFNISTNEEYYGSLEKKIFWYCSHNIGKIYICNDQKNFQEITNGSLGFCVLVILLEHRLHYCVYHQGIVLFLIHMVVIVK